MFAHFTRRDASKLAATTIVGCGATYSAEKVIESTTDIDTDSFAVGTGTTVFGAFTALVLMPRTDALVDNVADRLAIRKENRRNKKNAKNES